jgi:tetratricopeptide (TPR) repeat protein
MLLTRLFGFASFRWILKFAVICCIAQAPPSAASQNPTLDRARALEERGSFEEAAQQFQAILKNAPTSKQAQLGFGRSLAAMGHCEQATDALRTMLQDNSDAEAVVGVCYFRFHEFGAAISHLEQAVRLAPAEKGARIYLSRAYAGAGRHDEAIATLKSWLATNGDDPDALYWIGKLYEQSAQKTFDKMAQSHPDSYLIYQVEGEHEIEKREYQKAVVSLQRALALNPDDSGLHYWLGRAYWYLRDLDKARTELETALRSNPYHAQANYVLGDIFVTLRDPEKAIPLLERAVALNPAIWDAHRSLGRALVMENKLERAIQEFRIVADANPTDDTIHGLLSNAYRRSGNIPLALEEAKLYEKLNAERRDRVPKPSVEEPPSADPEP